MVEAKKPLGPSLALASYISHGPVPACSYPPGIDLSRRDRSIPGTGTSTFRRNPIACRTDYTNFWGGVWEPFLYGLNTHTLSVRRSKDTYKGGPRPEAFAQDSQATTGVLQMSHHSPFTLTRDLAASATQSMQTTSRPRPALTTTDYRLRHSLAIY